MEDTGTSVYDGKPPGNTANRILHKILSEGVFQVPEIDSAQPRHGGIAISRLNGGIAAWPGGWG